MRLRNLFSKGLLVLALVAMTACSTPTPTPTQVFPPTQATPAFTRPTAAATATLADSATPVPSATDLPTPTVTPTPPPSPTPSLTPNPVACNMAAFAGNVTLPDLTSVIPTRTYTKTWMLRNIGSCTWSTDYTIVFISGDQLGPNTSVRLPGAIKPGSYVNVSVNLVMPDPSKTTTYTSYWMLKSDSGEFFGIGTNGNGAFWAKVTIFVH